MTALQRKSLNKPDETRPFKDGKGKVDVVSVGTHTLGRGVFEPGQRCVLIDFTGVAKYAQPAKK
jgi:hypothetical protein